jgi:hypothetical protein
VLRRQAAVGVCLTALCLAGCGGGGKSSTTTSRTESESESSVKVSTATALRWPKVFCALRPGASQAQIIQLMGAPTASGSDAAGFPNLEWAALGYEFFADFNQAGDTSTKLKVIPDAESSQEPRMTSRLRGCPWL